MKTDFADQDIVADDELIVDSFCGGGGASEGIRMATGRDPDVAINHDEEAITMHKANHPNTEHLCQSIYQVDPADVVAKYRRRIGLAWFSPDCTHHSKARGGKPKQKHIRDLAWVVVHWADRAVWEGQRIRTVYVENVEEFQGWGPLLENGQPDPARYGFEFRRWLRAMKKLGYTYSFRELRASHHGTPTIRKRLFIVFRHDGERIGWPKITHGPGKARPYRTAAECINWSLPCPSIFLTKEEGKAIRAKRPLAEATMRRVAHGIDKYVVRAAQPFIVNLTHHGDGRCEDVDDPFRTITGANRGEKALVAPHITKFRTGSIGSGLDEPLHTITAGGKSARPAGHAHAMGLVTPVLVGCGGRAGQSAPRPVDKPYHTTTSKADTCVVVPYLTEHANASSPRCFPADSPLRTHCAGVKGGHFALCGAALVQTGYGEREGQDPRSLDPAKPLGTIVSSGKHAVAAAFLARHFGTSIGSEAGDPVGTITAKNKTSVTACFLAQHNNHNGTHGHSGRPADQPMSTIIGSGSHQSVVASSLVKLRGTCQHGQPVDEPAATISAQGNHLAHTAAFLTKYYGTDQAPEMTEPMHTVTSKDRFAFVEADLKPKPLPDWQVSRAHQVAALMRKHGLWDDREFVTVTIDGAQWIIVDIGIRMLSRRELFTANGFRRDYIIDPIFNGKPMTNTASVRMCGNSVPPQMAEAVIRANPRRMRTRERQMEIA